MEAVNVAFQCKLAWRLLHETNSLWVDLMRQKYLKASSLLDCSSKPSDSPVWKSILRSRSLLKKGIRWRVGNGARIKFWLDNWVDNCNLVDLLSLHSTPLPNPNCMVNEFINDDKTWKLQALRQVINDEHIVQKVLGIPLPFFDIEDSIC